MEMWIGSAIVASALLPPFARTVKYSTKAVLTQVTDASSEEYVVEEKTNSYCDKLQLADISDQVRIGKKDLMWQFNGDLDRGVACACVSWPRNRVRCFLGCKVTCDLWTWPVESGL